MSRPKNPLADYTSYNYHFLLLAGRDTSTMSAFAKALSVSVDGNGTASGTAAVQATVDKYNLLRTPGLTPGDIQQNSKGGDSSLIKFSIAQADADSVYMLVNTMVDSHYSIDNLQLETYMIGNRSLENSTLIATGISLDITEPSGVWFMNQLRDLFDNKLNTTFANCTFMLKIVFVGYLPDGTVEYNYDAKPFLMMPVNITGDFHNTGGKYSCQFVDKLNGAPAMHADAGYVPSGVSVGGATFNQWVTSLNTSLNSSCKYWYDAVKKQNPDAGMQVYYTFTFPQEWGNLPMRVNASSDITTTLADKKTNLQNLPYQERPATETASTDYAQVVRASDTLASAKSQMSFNTRIEIDEVLKEMVKSCPNIWEDQAKAALGTNVDSTALEKYAEDNISQFFTIKCSTTSDSKSIAHHYDITAVKPISMGSTTSTNTVTDKAQQATKDQQYRKEIVKDLFKKDADGIWVPKIGYVYDYIFTGHNIDVRDFTMHMNDGTTYFVLGNSTVDSILGTNSGAQRATLPGNSPVKNTPLEAVTVPNLAGMNKFTPIYPPFDKHHDEQKKYEGFKDEDADKVRRYVKDFNKFAMFSNLDTTVTISGNPDLLNAYVDIDYPHLTSSADWQSQVITPKLAQAAKDRDTKTYAEGKNATSDIMLMRVNINMPQSNWDPNVGQKFEADKFWYTGWYMCYTVQSSFVGGEFTQVLHLNAYLMGDGTDMLGIIDDDFLNENGN